MIVFCVCYVIRLNHIVSNLSCTQQCTTILTTILECLSYAIGPERQTNLENILVSLKQMTSASLT